MSAPPDLRDYQVADLARIEAAWDEGHLRVLYVLPTGGGKTVMFAEEIRREIERGGWALMLVHLRELVRQASEKLASAGIPHGVIMAGEPYAPLHRVQVACLPSLYQRAVKRERIALPPATLVIIDEAHRTVAKSYQDILEFYPCSKVLGPTATPVRRDGRGLGGFYQTMIVGPQYRALREAGHLARMKIYAAPPPDLRGVGKRLGDYVESQLSERVNTDRLVGDVVGTWLQRGEGLPTVAFAVDVAHSVHIRNEFRAAGVHAEHIDGSTSKAEREAAFGMLASGAIKALCNCAVLTEGWDLPATACGIIARPTMSQGLYIQMRGRISRPAPGKDYAVLLDHGGGVHMHGLPEDEIVWTLDPDRPAGTNRSHTGKDGKPSSSRFRECSQCGVMGLAGEPCDNCGFVPIKRARGYEFRDGELLLIDESGDVVKPGEVGRDEKQIFYQMLLGDCEQHGRKPGTAFYRYQEKFKGEKPPWAWRDLPPIPPSPEVARWIRSRIIAWAKSQERGAA